jgi:methylase of polypeptide subunit release factors
VSVMREIGGGNENADDGIAVMKGTVDRIICDPPFLSEDCQTKGMCAIV